MDIEELAQEAMDWSTQAIHVSPGTVDRAVRRVRRRRVRTVGVLTAATLGLTAAAIGLDRTAGEKSTATVNPAAVGTAAGAPGAIATLGPTAPPLRDSTVPVPPTARDLLRSLAVTAGAQPQPQPGRYDYVLSQGWQYEHEAGTDGGHSYVQRIVDQRWISDDGSGLIAESGTPSPKPAVVHYGPGQLEAPRAYPMRHLSALRAALLRNNPRASDAQEWMEIINGIRANQVIPPHLEAALLRLLADEPGIVDRGTVTDADGRSGVVVTANASQANGSVRDSLVFDPQTGALLDYVQTPSAAAADQTTEFYFMYLAAGRTNSDHVTP